MKFFAETLQLVVPSLLTRYLPVLLFNQHLESAVLAGLVPVVTAIVGWSLLSSLAILRSSDQFRSKQLVSGIGGLALGSAGFHVTIVLFGAPVVDLWPQTLLLAVLLSGCTTMPLALHLTCAPQKWLNLLLDLRVTNTHELYLACSSIGAVLGAYLGAFPIPLDWDRPWQQWPLTCVYGTLLGHAAGILTSVAIAATSTSIAKLAKRE
uniref:Glycosylphosphatidylinositol anchor biosynthesis protein 11 n=1 Tax=Peronospora matthiolae TaxID=2874970 RepID=A0AAV1VPA6_9STRA